MFNKPNLFPKAGEGNAARPGQPRSAGVNPQDPRRPATNATPPVPPVVPSTNEPASRGREEGGKGESRLIVGPEVKLKGAEILDCDTLVVEGRVEATMDSRVLRVAEGGAFQGKVGVDVAEVHGNFDGELTARRQLVIHSSGRVSGKIRYGSIFIEEGGQICGDISALGSDAASSDKPARKGEQAETARDELPLAG